MRGSSPVRSATKIDKAASKEVAFFIVCGKMTAMVFSVSKGPEPTGCDPSTAVGMTGFGGRDGRMGAAEME